MLNILHDCLDTFLLLLSAFYLVSVRAPDAMLIVSFVVNRQGRHFACGFFIWIKARFLEQIQDRDSMSRS